MGQALFRIKGRFLDPLLPLAVIFLPVPIVRFTVCNLLFFLCGLPAMVKAVKKEAYLKGASLSDIHGDAFELSVDTGAPLGQHKDGAATAG